ncbi:hypothetical protein OG2516_17850 [Oceanicola granulosus HTCC2516]|uniref:Glycoside hydrolase family 5 domain-containing protein n=1 Tax=Oceanicola granulosus (strain ATCC BAA-861 / DSM 15982 / KCTC 12143 / HTCC2516) TaxID=314256 RepID=Q2CF10_OCEGH|nr:hypothetical protein [Oceanicola granulosus]EAR51317.1 hypothetical protein OG2516_17850 [Oceanicola granulosus HTCC2516]
MTRVTIQGDGFLIDGKPTYEGRSWNGHKIEGLLLNTRMVQGTFDDVNPDTVHQWAYADTGTWDPDRNTSEFIAAMPEWRAHGMLAITVNLQGGSPYGYSKEQPWVNSAFEADGTLRPAFMERLRRILKAADELGMVVIVGLFYFGQEKVFEGDEDAVRRAVDNGTRWLLESGFENLLLEINNECNVRYELPVLMPEGVHELIERAKGIEKDGRRLLVGTSYGGGRVPDPSVVKVSDFMLLHGNGVEDPDRIREMVRQTRALEGYTPKPILFNEDDHFDFDKPDNNFVAAVSEYASWGYFDFRMEGEGYDDGYQSVPVNWGISSARKRGFFGLAKDMAGD